MNVFDIKILAHCLNGDKVPFIVTFDFKGTCYVYSSKMDLLLSIKTSMKPSSFFATSQKGLFLLSERGTMGYIDLEKKKYQTIKAPTGTTFGNDITRGCVFEVEGGFYLFSCNFVKKNLFYFYSYSTNSFEVANIKLPENCFSYGAGQHGAFFCLDREGNFQASPFKTTFEKKEFIPELTFGKEMISECLDYRGIFSLCHQVLHLSLEKGSLVMIAPIKPDTRAYAEHINDVLSGKGAVAAKAPELKIANKLILLKKNEPKKEVVLDGIASEIFLRPYFDSTFVVKHGMFLEAYRAEDLALLASIHNKGFAMGAYVLPDGRLVYDAAGDMQVLEPSPLTLVLK